MKAYRFIAKVSDKGTIQLPYNPTLFDQEVEIIILPKHTPEKEKGMKAMEFVEKWAGFLSDKDTDQTKFDFLSGRYK